MLYWYLRRAHEERSLYAPLYDFYVVKTYFFTRFIQSGACRSSRLQRYSGGIVSALWRRLCNRTNLSQYCHMKDWQAKSLIHHGGRTGRTARRTFFIVPRVEKRNGMQAVLGNAQLGRCAHEKPSQPHAKGAPIATMHRPFKKIWPSMQKSCRARLGGMSDAWR
jgi:hypothetical protein